MLSFRRWRQTRIVRWQVSGSFSAQTQRDAALCDRPAKEIEPLPEDGQLGHAVVLDARPHVALRLVSAGAQLAS